MSGLGEHMGRSRHHQQPGRATSGTAVERGQGDRLRAELAECIVSICRKATAHNSGQTVYGYGVHQETGHFEVHMSSWPRGVEAIHALTDAGFVATEGATVDYVRVVMPLEVLMLVVERYGDRRAAEALLAAADVLDALGRGYGPEYADWLRARAALSDPAGGT